MILHVAPMTIEYVAAMIDGDGTITATAMRSSRLSRTDGISFMPRVQIANQNLAMLVEIMGVLKCGDIRAYIGGFSGCYRYDVPAKHVVRVLTDLIPHLRNKREQAFLVLEGMKTRSRGSHKITLEIRQIREALVMQIQELNKRDGKAYRTNWVNSVKRSSLVTAYESIPSQAAEGEGSAEGVTTRSVSPNNNPIHEDPARKGRDSLTSRVI